MFGVLRPQRQSIHYRRLYARLCQHYRTSFGLSAVLWLNYETIFLYAIAFDLGLLPTASIKDQQCCGLRRDRTLADSSDRQLGSLLASIGLLVGSLKVDDNLRDRPGLATRLTHAVYSKLFTRAHRALVDRDPELQAKLTTVLSAQKAVEAREGPASLDAFSEPTVLGFTAIFDLFARQLNLPTSTPLLQLARPVARAVVSYDQAIDFERDRQGEGYTVLSCKVDQLAALDHARLQIEEAHSISSAWLGPRSLASQILEGFQYRIKSSITRLQSATAPRPWRPSLANIRTIYWAILGLIIPTAAMATEVANPNPDDDCTSNRCCCFCAGFLCGAAASESR